MSLEPDEILDNVSKLFVICYVQCLVDCAGSSDLQSWFPFKVSFIHSNIYSRPVAPASEQDTGVITTLPLRSPCSRETGGHSRVRTAG